MTFSAEDLEDQKKFRLFLTIPYTNLIQFVFEYLKKKSGLMFLYWFLCLLFLCFTLFIRIRVSGNFPTAHIILHTFIGMIVLPLICIPLHELLHVIPYYLSGAKNIRVGMDLKQYLFYVTAHRYVATPSSVQDCGMDSFSYYQHRIVTPCLSSSRLVEMEPFALSVRSCNYVCW